MSGQKKFTAAVARRDLEVYLDQGPDPTTRLLRDQVLAARVSSPGSVLDVGAGVGALSFELLAGGAERVTAVEASAAYLHTVRDELARRSLTERVQLVHGDFVVVAGDIAPADVVVMDRVVCCYPSFEPLLEAGVRHSRRVFAFSYPRNRWHVRAKVALGNLGRAIMRNPFRMFVHPISEMQGVLERHGLVRTRRDETRDWFADLYVRMDVAGGA